MKREKENWVEAVKNIASGYGAVVLSVLCFLLALTMIVAIVRFVVGMGTGTGV